MSFIIYIIRLKKSSNGLYGFMSKNILSFILSQVKAKFLKKFMLLFIYGKKKQRCGVWIKKIKR